MGWARPHHTHKAGKVTGISSFLDSETGKGDLWEEVKTITKPSNLRQFYHDQNNNKIHHDQKNPSILTNLIMENGFNLFILIFQNII